MPAPAIEEVVAGCLQRLSDSGVDTRLALLRVEVHPATIQLVIDVAAFFPKASDPVSQIEALAERLGDQGRILTEPRASEESAPRHPARITLVRRIGKTSGRVRITDGEGRHTSTKGNLDAALVGALLGAHQSLRGSQAGRSLGAEHLATEAAPKSPYQRNLARLAFLAPDIQKLILEGRQPATLTIGALRQRTIPCAWDEQRRLFDIPC